MNNQPNRSSQPSWGATIGMFFGCWILAFIACVFVSMLVVSTSGAVGYSRGGLSMLVVALISAAYYRSTSKGSAAATGALVAGAVIGVVAAYAGMSLY